MSSADSVPKDEEAIVSLLPIKEIHYSLSPILGLALVALVLTCLGMVDGMTTSLDALAGLATFFLFGVGATWAITFRF